MMNRLQTLVSISNLRPYTVVAAGFFSSSPATFGGVALTTAGGYDAVLWKVNAEGTTLWAVRG